MSRDYKVILSLLFLEEQCPEMVIGRLLDLDHPVALVW
jgi:hypothetical protein